MISYLLFAGACLLAAILHENDMRSITYAILFCGMTYLCMELMKD
jgi:hypothetical protein